MALQDIECAAETPFHHLSEAEFEAGLVNLMPLLRGFAQSLSGNREIAEDLAQSALVKAWRCRRSFTPGTNLKAWLCTILRNEYTSHHRRAWRQIPWDAELAETIPTPHGEQQWSVELFETARAMHTLPATQRDALILVGVGGFSHEDVAALTRCAVGTVKSRVGRARQALRTILDSRTSLRVKSRSAIGGPVGEILAQLDRYILGDTRRAIEARTIQ